MHVHVLRHTDLDITQAVKTCKVLHAMPGTFAEGVSMRLQQVEPCTPLSCIVCRMHTGSACLSHVGVCPALALLVAMYVYGEGHA